MPAWVFNASPGVQLGLRLAEKIRTQGYPFMDLSCPASDSDKDIHAY